MAMRSTPSRRRRLHWQQDYAVRIRPAPVQSIGAVRITSNVILISSMRYRFGFVTYLPSITVGRHVVTNLVVAW